MATKDYSRFVRMAHRLIDKYGQDVTYKQQAKGEPDDLDKPWNQGPREENDQEVRIAFLPANRATLKYVSGKTINEGDLVGYMAPQDFEPKTADAILRADKKIETASATPIDPGGTVCLWILGLKK